MDEHRECYQTTLNCIEVRFTEVRMGSTMVTTSGYCRQSRLRSKIRNLQRVEGVRQSGRSYEMCDAKRILRDCPWREERSFQWLRDEDIDSETMIKSFTEQIWKIRDTETPVSSGFTTLANIESLLNLNRNVLPHQSLKFKELKWHKEVYKAKLPSLKSPYAQAM